MELHEILKAERTRLNISQSDIVYSLKDMKVDVSPATISRVEKGWVPSWPIVLGYCEVFGWTLSELERRMNLGTSKSSSLLYFDSKRKISASVGREITLITWVEAGFWADSPSTEEYEQEKIFVTGKMPKNTFALRVNGHSMENCGGKHHFPDESIILVNPDADAKPNDFVVVSDELTREATFKQLINDCGISYLNPLNPKYPVMRVTESTVVKGVVFRCIDDRKV